MSKREELEKDNKAFKLSLERQVKRMKGDLETVGKSALMIGGGLFATYFIMDALTARKRKKKADKPKKEKAVVQARPKKDNLLMSTAKEQAIVFLLGLAAQQLAAFLSELDTEESEDAKEST